MNAAMQRGKTRSQTKESKATMNSEATTNVTALPSTPNPQTATEVIAANGKYLSSS